MVALERAADVLVYKRITLGLRIIFKTANCHWLEIHYKCTVHSTMWPMWLEIHYKCTVHSTMWPEIHYKCTVQYHVVRLEKNQLGT